MLKINLFRSAFSKNNFKFIFKLSIPVFVTYLIITCAVGVFTHFLAPFGRDILSAFGVAYRIQTLILLPAISIGSAVGILCNRSLAPNHSKALIKQGVLLCLFLYFILTIFVYLYANNIVFLITSDLNIVQAAAHYMRIISFSYMGLAISLCMCLVWDQIGYGFISTLLTLFVFIVEIIFATILMQYVASPDMIYWALVIGNILFGLISLSIILFNPARMIVSHSIFNKAGAV